MPSTTHHGAEGAETMTAAIAWLAKRLKAARSDSEAHPAGHSNRTFYEAQAIAYENVLSLLENQKRTAPALASHPAGQSESPVLRAVVEVYPDRTDTRLTFGDRIRPEPGVKAVEQAIAALTAEYEARGGCPVVGRLPAGQSTDDRTDHCGICDKPLISCQRVIQDVELGTVHAACCGPEREAYVKDVETGEPLGPNDPIPQGYAYHPAGQSTGLRREVHTVFDPARTTSDPYDDRPGPWYDMKKVREIEAATGVAFASVYPECVMGRDTDGLVEGFAAALKAKLRAAEAKHGWKNGWLKNDWEADCQSDLMHHVGKGDPLDVAAYAAFCWHHGWPTATDSTRTGDEGGVTITLTRKQYDDQYYSGYADGMKDGQSICEAALPARLEVPGAQKACVEQFPSDHPTSSGQKD